MAVKTSTYASTPASFPTNRLLAVGVWLLGCGATYLVITALLGPGAPWYLAAVTATAVQAMLTAAEWRMFVHGARSEVGVIALVCDVACNAAGLYFPMTRFGQTTIGLMLADVTGADPTVGRVAALVLAVLLGYLLARAPEYIWQAD